MRRRRQGWIRGVVTYCERLGVYAVLDHGDADGEGAAVEVRVLSVSVSQGLLGSMAMVSLVLQTDQKGGNLVENVDCLLGRSLLLGPLGGWHLGRRMPFVDVEVWLSLARDARWGFNWRGFTRRSMDSRQTATHNGKCMDIIGK
jgi:hypothetical protein